MPRVSMNRGVQGDDSDFLAAVTNPKSEFAFAPASVNKLVRFPGLIDVF